MQTIENADKLILRGDEEKKSLSLFSNKYVKAFKYYKEASIIYQLHKQWDKCAIALIKCLECKEKIEYDFDSPAQYYMDIASCYKNVYYINGYITYLEKANEIFKMNGQFDQIIRNYTQLGTFYEEQYRYQEAIKCYQDVLDIEEVKMTKSLINYYNTKLKLAELYIKHGKEYDVAIKYYDETISYYSNKNDLYSTYKIPELFLNIMLCYLCIDDEVMTKRKLGEYFQKYPRLHNTNEIRLIESIIENGYEDKTAITHSKLTPLQYRLISIMNNIEKKKDEPDFC